MSQTALQRHRTMRRPVQERPKSKGVGAKIGSAGVFEVRSLFPLLSLALLTLAACDVDNDAGNESVTVEYNKQQIRDTAREAGRAARDVASGVGNVAAASGRAIKNEVGDVDVDVEVHRNRTRDANENSSR
jgi:hypothetical protein